MNVVLLFPGQGSQKPGMARDLADAFPTARAALDDVDRALEAPLTRLMFEGPADELTLTNNAQPALLAHGAAAWAALRDRLAPHVRAAAGHSLGEFTAYLAAGALSLEHAARLVRERGRLMLESGQQAPGTMAAVLGATAEPIDEICRRASSEAGLVVPANYNDAEQTVVSGTVAGVEKAMELAKAAGAKLAKRLQVSGAFHSPLMAGAAAGLQRAIESAGLRGPSFPVYSNVTAEPVTEAAVARDVLLRQLTSPVRWVEVMKALAAAHPGALFLELGPGNVLTKLATRVVPGLKAQTCGTVADVENLLAQLPA